jgi:acyl carrier protein
VRELNSSNDNKAILQVNSSINDLPSFSMRQLIESNIIKFGFDPSHVTNIVNDSVISPYEATTGIGMKDSKLESHSTITHFFRKILESNSNFSTTSVDSPEDTKILVIEPTFSDQTEIRSIISVASEKIFDGNGNSLPTFFKFELLNSAGIAIQTIQEPVDVLKLLEVYYTPKLPPIVHFGSFDTTNKATIRVKQVDPLGSSVKVFRKNLEYSTNGISEYQFVAEYALPPKSGFITIPVEVSPHYTTIYRVIPTGRQGSVSPEFTNIVINPKKVIKRRKYVAMTTRIISTGISIDVSDVPVDAVSLMILKKDSTIKSDWSVVGNSVVQINTIADASTYSIVDTALRKGHVYQYVCRLVYKNGDNFDAGNACVEFYPLVENLVDTQISDVNVSYEIDNFDVTFNLKSIIEQTDLDSIKNLLESQGMLEFFSSDILTERDKLQNLVAHSIDRVDLTDGIRETFGVVTDSNFSDSTLRKINSVSPLQAGHKYRYEVSALLRSPETLFDNFKKTAIDSETKKQYSYYPAKFQHPITLTHGNIVTSQTLAAHYPKTKFSFGNVGNVSTIDVSFANDSVSISDSSAEEFDRVTNLVKWNVNGPATLIDHFLILKEFLGQREIVGKTHALNDTLTFNFYHLLSSSEIGEFNYVIVPVFKNYALGQESKTNTVSVE